MVLEYFGIANIYLNTFFTGHITFISHVLAAVFLLLSETSVNFRIIAPILDWIEGTFFGNLPLLPNLAATALFIIWATFSIFLYEMIIKYLLNRYIDSLTIILIVAFVGIAFAVNIKYRD